MEDALRELGIDLYGGCLIIGYVWHRNNMQMRLPQRNLRRPPAT
jgi:hypothetical protein